MTEQERYFQAGKYLTQMSLTDKELNEAIECTRNVLEYFEAQGDFFGLIKTHLRGRLDPLERMKEERN